MPLLSIDLHEPVAAPPIKWGPPVRFVLASANVSRGSIPGRGLLRSILIHEIVLYALIFLSSRPGFTPPLRSETFRMIDLRATNEVIYLPPLGGGEEGGGRQKTRPRLGKGGRHRAGHAAPSPASNALIYPGPQAIISDVPKPTNTVQTILQPELKNPPLLKPLVPLPNIVQMAHAEPLPLADPMKARLEAPPAEPVVPKIRLEPTKPVEAPQLTLPKNVPQISPSSALPPRPKLPERVVVPKVPLEPARPVAAPLLALPKNVPPISASLTLPARPKLPERPVVPKVQLEPAKPVEAPRLALPSNTPQNFPAQPTAKPPEPRAQAAEKPPEKPVQNSPGGPNSGSASPPGATGNDLHTLLVLSPMPAPSGQSVKIPAGEARGRFAISPEPNPAGAKGGLASRLGDRPSLAAGGSGKGAGSSGNGPAGGTGGVGNSAGAGSEGTAGVGVGAGEGTNAGDGAGALGGGQGSGSGSGSGLGTRTSAGAGGLGFGRGTGSGSGSGSGAASGSGLGAGTGTGNGVGAGSGSGGGLFAGITVQGGSLTGKATTRPIARAAPPPSATPPPRGSYGLTIVSTASSGGGLADFGVFRNEQVYTVYLDMRRTVDDPAPSWTLQYALLREAAVDGNPANPPERAQEGLLPPIPLSKEQPQWPVELLRRYQHRLMVVSAIINKEGKFEHLLVKQSPNAQLDGPLLEALGKWIFRPGELNGEKISVKALLGIPVEVSQ